MSAEGSKKAILAAMLANAGIAIAKFIGFLITSSSSMLAESVHSLADTSNQGLLLIGQRQAKKRADQLHPFGFGRSRYFYSFVVALVIFSLGSMFALYEGYAKLTESGHEIQSPLVAIGILVIAIGLESFSFYTAIRESRPLKGTVSWWRFIRQSRNPELPVVLLEDLGALVGLFLALFGVGMSALTHNAIWDGVGTLAIGVLLGVIAIVLIVEMKSLLIGEGATADDERKLFDALNSEPSIDRVIHMKTQYLGPEELLVAAKIAIPPNTSAAQIAVAIDQAEKRVRDQVPQARVIYLEPDIDRGSDAGAAATG